MTDQEINEAVARKLGWYFIFHETGTHGKRWGNPAGTITGFLDCPDYCHSIAAAWGIVEANHLSGVMRIGLGWRAIGNNGATGASDLQADTAPMAICLAFLKNE